MNRHDNEFARAIEQALGEPPASVSALAGGCVGDVRLVTTRGGDKLVAKFDGSGASALDVEGRSLTFLREIGQLPTPRVIAASPTLLLLAYIDATDPITDTAQQHAAALLAQLHSVTPQDNPHRFGFHCNTRIGGLEQPNGWLDDWPAFFARRRLVAMADLASRAGQLPAPIRKRVDSLAQRLPEFLDSRPRAALVHGDVWSGNVLCKAGTIAAFIDPAPYFGNAEVELAFITLFNTFSQPFFDAYQQRRPIARGFFETRRHVYNIYPLLVHVHLFGGGYIGQLDATLRCIGF